MKYKEREYRIVPSETKINCYWVQYRDKSRFIPNFWKTDVDYEGDGLYIHCVKINYPDGKSAEKRIREKMEDHSRFFNRQINDEIKASMLRAWAGSIEPRKVPPFLFDEDEKE